VAPVSYSVPELFILDDYYGVGSHSGCLFAQLFLDKIAAHPRLRPDPDLAQLDVTPPRPALDEHHMIGMGSSEMRCTGI